MDFITRQFGLLCLGALAAALTACPSNNVSQCATSGILCPAGTHCAAVQAICIADSNLCGNGDPTDPNEECDDGNTMDGDGCSHECKTEVCGNHIIDKGEVCDLGPGMNGKCKGCAADCKSFEVCGDGVRDTACEEACDDHNTVGKDGCSADCKSTEVCGNKVIDFEVGEVCDDGADKNGTPGNECDANCRSTLKCGNGTVDKDKGEECDNADFGPGNPNGNNNNNDCRADCQFNRCGDGLVDMQTGARHEDCDRGQPVGLTPVPVETVDCNIDCTTPSCGDGKVNHHFTPKDALGNPAAGPEQCDNGTANNDNTACTLTCQVNVCGDHHKLTGVEACDDGGVDTNNCNANCTAPTCGDGHVNLQFTPKDALGNPAPGPEQCDNGTVGGTNQNQNSAACTSTCQINVCGDHHVLVGIEACDSGGVDAMDCDPDCTKPVCGDGHRNEAAGEACDDGDKNGTADSVNHCNQFCQINTCGNGVVEHGEDCDAGSNGVKANSAACDDNCTFARCGDGFTNPAAGEACDEGAANGTLAGPTHCNQFCQFNSCGDGILEPGEQCDDGKDSKGDNNNHAGARCNQVCKFNVCGDADKLVGVEQCDPGKDALGNVQDTSACDHDCTLPVCGDGVPNTMANEECDDGPDNGKPGHCDSACKSIKCGNGVVDVGEDCDDGAGGVRKNSARCNSNCTFAQCGDGFVNDQFKPDGVHTEVCDRVDMTGAPLNGVPCDYGNPFCVRCNATCTIDNVSPGGPFCGDFLTQSEPGMDEKCDPGTGPSTSTAADPPSRLARADSAACDIDCTLVACGDGHVNAVALESCDDGNQNACGTCQAANCKNAAAISATQATSTITTINGDKIGNGDTFKLDDGLGTSATFEFTLSGTPQDGNNVAITFAQDPATDAATIASRMVTAINTKTPAAFLITASVPMDGTTVTLTNGRKSSFGNTDIVVTGLIGIAGTGFTFNPSPPKMAGGAAGDCLMGTGCVTGDDCKSGVCSTAIPHVCQ